MGRMGVSPCAAIMVTLLAKETDFARSPAACSLMSSWAPTGVDLRHQGRGFPGGHRWNFGWPPAVSASSILRRLLASTLITQGGSRMPELGPSGFVRGAPSNGSPDRDPASRIAASPSATLRFIGKFRGPKLNIFEIGGYAKLIDWSARRSAITREDHVSGGYLNT